jgi:hypothetical protein
VNGPNECESVKHGAGSRLLRLEPVGPFANREHSAASLFVTEVGRV